MCAPVSWISNIEIIATLIAVHIYQQTLANNCKNCATGLYLTEPIDITRVKIFEEAPMTEFSQKQDRIKALLNEHGLDALLLQRSSSFAWATCGAASYVNTAATNGTAALLITPNERYLITNNIEAPRFEKEEKLFYQGWKFEINPWYQSQEIITQLTKGIKLGADGVYPNAIDLSVDIARLRASLIPEEGIRFRVLGRLCAEAMNAAARSIQPGQTEHQIAARLALEAHNRGLLPIVNLVAADERVFAYRHPLPTNKFLKQYAMLVLCGRRWGLVSSITRLVHFGLLPDKLRQKAEAVTRVDAAMIAATHPGATLEQVFQCGLAAYADVGYPDEWKLHHQGGPAGYEPREFLATPKSPEKVITGQVYAWNPSITGVKSEDSILIGEKGNEIITAIPDWPTTEVEIDNRVIPRPVILQLS